MQRFWSATWATTMLALGAPSCGDETAPALVSGSSGSQGSADEALGDSAAPGETSGGIGDDTTTPSGDSGTSSDGASPGTSDGSALETGSVSSSSETSTGVEVSTTNASGDSSTSAPGTSTGAASEASGDTAGSSTEAGTTATGTITETGAVGSGSSTETDDLGSVTSEATGTSSGSSDNGSSGATGGGSTTTVGSSDDGGEPCTWDGPHVSRDTCDPADQCGTVERPWCTISAGLASTATSPLMVAGALDAYLENVEMRDGIDVLGGYEASFTADRNVDPQTNATTIRAPGTVVNWDHGVAAALDGFTIVSERITISPQSFHAAVTIRGDAFATLANAHVRPEDATSFATSAYALYLTAGSGGDVTIEGLTTLEAPRGSSVSTALASNVAAAPSALVVEDATLISGYAQHARAIDHAGLGLLQVTNALLQPGSPNQTGTGVRAGGPGYEGTELVDTVIAGSGAPTAIGIQHLEGGYLTVTGGSITGGGIDDAETVAVGLSLDGVALVELEGVVVAGTEVVAPGVVAVAAAIELLDTADVGPLETFISQSTLEGGPSGTERIGVLADGVSADISTSTVVGSSVPGGTRAYGVRVVGAFPPGSPSVSLHDNVLLGGGIPISFGGSIDNVGAGVSVATSHPVSIHNNTAVEGCTGACNSTAHGVQLVQAGSAHAITANGAIIGGPAEGGGIHVGVYILESDATIQGNAYIAGNDSPTQRPVHARGIHVRGSSDVAIESNALILGGYSWTPSTTGDCTSYGIHVWAPNFTDHATLSIRDNEILAGTARQEIVGLHLVGNHASMVERNVIRTCPLSGDDPLCRQGRASAGLGTLGDEGSLYANNYIFGGYTDQAYGAVFGCLIEWESCHQDNDADVRFEGNLFHVVGRPHDPGYSSTAYGFLVEDFNQDPGQTPMFVNNIFFAEDVASQSHALRYSTGFDAGSFVLQNNDFLAADCLVSALNDCATTSDEVDALNGNGLVTVTGSISADPLWVAPDFYLPSAAGFHLDPTCALADLGVVTSVVIDDFDGDPRGDGDSGLPEPGPDECP